MSLQLLSTEVLRKVCPLKWNTNVPINGFALGMADIDFAGPEGIADFIKLRLNDDLGFYQAKSGLETAIRAAAEYLKAKGTTINSFDEFQVIPGTMMGIYSAMKYTSRKEGKILMTNPIYPPIHFHSSYEQNQMDWIDIIDQNINEDLLLEKIDSSVKLLAINNPNNPTGYVYTQQDLDLIGDLAEDNDFLVFSDELYEPLTFTKPFIPAASREKLQGRTISLYGFSKAYGLAGFRSGFMHLSLQDKGEIKEVIEHLMVSPSPITSFVLEFALTSPSSILWKEIFRKEMQKTTEFAAKFLTDNGIKTNIPDGCFFVFPNLGLDDDKKFTDKLLKVEGVEVVAGSLFGPKGKGHVRVNCATGIDRLTKGLEKLVKLRNSFYY